MKIVHRYDSEERQHYLLEQSYTFHLKPRLLYVGSLSKQEKWSEISHSHQFVEILFIVDGKGTVVFENSKKNIQKGDIVIYNANVLHAEYSDPSQPLEALFIGFDKLSITNLEPNCLIPPQYDCIYSTEDMYQIFKHYFDFIIEELTTKNQFYSDIAQNTLQVMLMQLFRLLTRSQCADNLLKQSEALYNALNYIDQHYLENINLDSIAAECFVTKYYLSHLFAKYQQMTIGKYIFNKRMDDAKHMLSYTDDSVLSIAEQAGFHDLSYFCRAFKKANNMTPLQYRKSQKKANEKLPV